jgi:hypothetical protein
LAVEIIATGFAGLRFLRQSHRNMTEDFINVYGNYAIKLLRLQKSPSSTSMCMPAGRRWSAWSKARGEGINRNQRINPVQNKLPMHLSRRCGARTRNGSPCRSAAMPNGRCRMHGGMSPGAPKGNKNAFKHGHYAAEAIASRREVAKLLRDARALVKQVS